MSSKNEEVKDPLWGTIRRGMKSIFAPNKYKPKKENIWVVWIKRKKNAVVAVGAVVLLSKIKEATNTNNGTNSISATKEVEERKDGDNLIINRKKTTNTRHKFPSM